MGCNFGPASPDEEIVCGACRLGRHDDTEDPEEAVTAWIAVMQERGIERVCCLLDRGLTQYDDLLGQYETAFGQEQVCHAPVPD